MSKKKKRRDYCDQIDRIFNTQVDSRLCSRGEGSGKIGEIWVDDCFAPDKGRLTHEERYNTTWVRFSEARMRVFDQYTTLRIPAKATVKSPSQGESRDWVETQTCSDCRCGGHAWCNPHVL